MDNLFFVIAKYNSKYGQIVYCTKVKSVNDVPDLDNVYINTFYFKGKEDIQINSVYQFQYIKGENGLTYCFLT